MREHYNFSTMKGIKNPYVNHLKQQVKTYEFRLVLTQSSELTDDQSERLHEFGCDDGTLVSRDGINFMVFSRESESLEEAIRSATSDVRNAGFDVQHVEMPCLV